MIKLYPQHGYIALLSILIISTLLLTTTLSLAQFSMAQRFFLLDAENKRIANELAIACAEVAQMLSYSRKSIPVATPVIFPINDSECSLISITDTGTLRTVITEGRQHQTITTVKITIETRTGEIVAWQEL